MKKVNWKNYKKGTENGILLFLPHCAETNFRVKWTQSLTLSPSI